MMGKMRAQRARQQHGGRRVENQRKAGKNGRLGGFWRKMRGFWAENSGFGVFWVGRHDPVRP